MKPLTKNRAFRLPLLNLETQAGILFYTVNDNKYRHNGL